jgi:hypothetical protein
MINVRTEEEETGYTGSLYEYNFFAGGYRQKQMNVCVTY